MSGLMHKVKDAVTGDHHNSTHTSNTTGTHHSTHHTTTNSTTTNHGPHHSKLANKLDPRVNSAHGTLCSHLKLSANANHYA